eukprot:GHVP01027275.1.p1 GENE.GHVP01027275.1~~GHVP01027275.1.p1  ORF type:complete len:442 (-),score=64.17 GHVP01027275.1:48-1184(-)
MQEGRFENHSDGRGAWRRNLIRGLSEGYNNELHIFTPYFPVEECFDCFKDGSCGYDASACGDEILPGCYEPCSTKPAEWWGPETLDGIPGWMNFLLDELKTSAVETDTSDRWSIASWSRQFYFFLHMFGDLHTPLHVGGASESSCQNTDDGQGTFLIINETNAGCQDGEGSLYRRMAQIQPRVQTLHFLWDSLMWHDDAGLLPPRTKSLEDYYLAFKDMSDMNNQLNVDAQYILEKWPFEDMAKKYDLDADFESIAKESHWWSRHFIYNFTLLDEGSFDCRNNADEQRTKWMCVPDWYILQAHEIQTSRIALTAYRMERHLAEIIDQVDYHAIKDQIIQNRCLHEEKFNLCNGNIRSLEDKLKYIIQRRKEKRTLRVN